jgi:GT2 family glycosyltransferase
MNKRITIVIVTYNGRTDLPECLESVFYQNYPKDLFKVVIIDNNSSDSTVGYLKEEYPQVKLIENKKNVGFAEANNQGYFLAQKDKADYLVLLNQDTIAETNWLLRMVSIAEKDDRVGIVQPKLLLHPEKDLINSYGNSIHYLGFAFCNHYREKDTIGKTEPFELPYASGAAPLIRMSSLKKIEYLFDDRFFMYHEDVDLGWRMRLAGYKVLFDPLSTVYHKYSYSKAKYKFYHMEKNRWAVIFQNYRVLTLILLAPMLLAMELGQVLYSIKNGWFVEKMKGWGWVIGHIPSILSRRVDVQFKIRNKVSDREIMRLFVGSIKFQELKYPLLTYVVNPLMEAYFWVVKKIIFW